MFLFHGPSSVRCKEICVCGWQCVKPKTLLDTVGFQCKFVTHALKNSSMFAIISERTLASCAARFMFCIFLTSLIFPRMACPASLPFYFPKNSLACWNLDNVLFSVVVRLCGMNVCSFRFGLCVCVRIRWQGDYIFLVISSSWLAVIYSVALHSCTPHGLKWLGESPTLLSGAKELFDSAPEAPILQV